MDVKITLDEKSIPGEWYNIVPDLPFDLPPATSARTGYRIGLPALKEEKTILFALNAHGYFDLGAYESYLAGRLEEGGSPTERITSALTRLPTVPKQDQN
jgi:predicted alternative tryptophan synthase beta-subunit